MSKQIQDFNFLYWFFKPLVMYSARCHYNSFVVKHRENLPTEGSYILAPCHQQALMEPLAILHVTRRPTVFLARADIFAKPAVRAFLTFLKILPVYRIRDGKESLSKNAAIFESSERVLLDGYPLCLMAEGKHNNRHQLLPLVKGMFRIAGEAKKKLGSTPLFIVPVGIDFEDYELPYSNLSVDIGKPIPVEPFMQEFEENEPVALNKMRSTVAEAMRGKMHDVRSSQNYEEIITLVNALNATYRRRKGLSGSAWSRFQVRKRLSVHYDELEQTQPERFSTLASTAREYSSLSQKLRFPLRLNSERLNLLELLFGTAAVAAFVAACFVWKPVLDVALFLLLCFPIPWLPTHLIMKRKVADTQFRSSFNYGVRFVLTWLYSVVLSIVVCCTHGLWLHDYLPQLNGFLWGVIAFDVPLLLARPMSALIPALRSLARNWQYRFTKLLRRKEVRKLDEMLASMSKTLPSD